MEMSSSGQPPLLVPSLLWGGAGDGSLYKVPMHTFGSAKKRFLRLKPVVDDTDAVVDVTLFDDQTHGGRKYSVVKAAFPLALVWSDLPKSNAGNAGSASPSTLFKKKDSDKHELLLGDIVQVVGGNRTAAFQAYVAKNGSWSIPHESCCFSLITEKRSVDFYISSSAGINRNGRDSTMASAWKDSIETLIDNFHRRQRTDSLLVPLSSQRRAINQSKRWNPKLHRAALFEAAKNGDVESLRWFFDNGCPIDFMDSNTGDSVLLVACRLGLFEVAELALLEYDAHNDVHPDWGETALQIAVSYGHANIVELLLSEAATSNVDQIISNHDDSNGQVPLHVAARCGSTEILELLVRHGADTGYMDKEGRTCLHLAAQAGQPDSLDFLLDMGAKEYIEVLSNDGFTPLHLAVKANKSKCVRILLDAGASVCRETADGSNVYSLAVKAKCSERITKLLLEYDISDGDSYSFDEDDADSSHSGDMFEGLNTYSVGGFSSPGRPSRGGLGAIGGSPYVGSLVSPGNALNYYRGPPSFTRSPYFSTIKHSPIVAGSRPLFAAQPPRQPIFAYGTASTSLDEESCCFDGETWEVYATDDGHPYYYNANRDTTTWDDPRIRRMTPQPDVQRSPAPYTRKLTPVPLPNKNQKSSPRPTTAPAVSTLNGTIGSHMNQQLSEAEANSGNLSPSHFLSTPSSPQSPAAVTSPIREQTIGGPNTVDSKANENPECEIMTTGSEKQKPMRQKNPQVENVDPKAMLLAHIKARAEHPGNNGTSDKPESVTNVGGNSDGNDKRDVPNTASTSDVKDTNVVEGGLDDFSFAKYTTMKKVGVPLPAILNKMTQDGIAADKRDQFRDLHDNPQRQSVPSTAMPTVHKAGNTQSNTQSAQQSKDELKQSLLQDESCKKFMRMKSFGVPAEAVAHKMKQEGINEEKIALFKELNDLVSSAAPPKETPSKSSHKHANVTKADLDDATFGKYLKMSNVGVPAMAIATKMKQDGVDQEKVHMFSVAFGLKPTGSVTPKPFPLPPRPSGNGRRRASKALQKIHWTTVSEERLSNSLWASNTNEDDDIKECEIEKLESLFSASPIKPAGGGTGRRAIDVIIKKQQATTLIDPKRANNIAIALAQFRAFPNFDDLCQAVASLDGTHLNVEKLQNMELLLPKPEEVVRLKQFSDQAADSLGRAELFFLSVMKIPRFSQKLSAFKYSLQFEEQAESLKSHLRLLGKACGEVIDNKKLAVMLRRVLAIGNIMNESSGKPVARGITLDSLIKTAKKKGSDGKTTVLDHLITSAMTQKLDFVDFFSGLPSIRKAMRFDLDEFRSLLKECEMGAQSVGRLIETEKSESTPTQCLDRLEPFLQHATAEIENIKCLFGDVKDKVQTLCSFFAEDHQTCKSSTIFEVLLDFSRLVEKSQEQYHRRLKAEKRRKSMAQKRPSTAPHL